MPFDLTKLIEQFRPMVGTGRHHLIICQPKSGSTFIANVVAELTGLPKLGYATTIENGHVFSVTAASLVAKRDAVIHLHSLPSPGLMAWIKAKDLRPIVIYRDVNDSLVSMLDHKKQRDHELHKGLSASDQDDALTAIAYEWGYWYLRYHKQWQENAAIFPGLHIHYEEVFADLPASLPGILDHLGVPWTPERLDAAISAVGDDAGRSNLNVGRAGRGLSLPANVQHDLDTVRRAMGAV